MRYISTDTRPAAENSSVFYLTLHWTLAWLRRRWTYQGYNLSQEFRWRGYRAVIGTLYMVCQAHERVINPTFTREERLRWCQKWEWWMNCVLTISLASREYLTIYEDTIWQCNMQQAHQDHVLGNLGSYPGKSIARQKRYFLSPLSSPICARLRSFPVHCLKKGRPGLLHGQNHCDRTTNGPSSFILLDGAFGL